MNVGAGGKRAVAGAGQDHRLDLGIGFVLGQRVVELADQREAQRIELFRAVQGDDADAVEALGPDKFIGHGLLSFDPSIV